MRIDGLAKQLGIATSKIRFRESRYLVYSSRLRNGHRDYDQESLLMITACEGNAFGLTEFWRSPEWSATPSLTGLWKDCPVIHPEPAGFFGACGDHSFVTQGHYGIYAHRPTGGNKASHKCYGSNHEHNGRKGDWIVGADIKE